MPLPQNASLPLQGVPVQQSKPKHAMLFRMSAETFDALEDLPKVEFKFGDNPGLYIGDSFFPVQQSKESLPHELYLRVASQGKPMVPLKLCANVVGKMKVDAQLSDEIRQRVRERQVEAEAFRKGRSIKKLDAPPTDLSKPTKKAASKTKKEKGPVVPRRAQEPLPPARPPPATATSSSAGSSKEGAATRSRVIHCLALRSRPMDKVIQMCAGDMPQAEIKSVIHAVAEHDPDGSESLPLWRLKINSWREVRPWDYPKLTDAERQRLATQARSLFKDLLKVPDTDPVWDHVRPRKSKAAEQAEPSSRAGSSAEGPRNGVLSTSKGTKKTTKADTARSRVSDIVVPAKDESKKGKARAVDRDLDEGELSSVGTPTSVRPGGRRQPGSGYRAKPSATPPVSDPRAASPMPPKRPVDARRRELPAPSGPAKPQPPIAPPSAGGSRANSVAAAAAQIRKRNAAGTPRLSEDERPSASSKVEPLASPPPPKLPTFKKNKRLQDEIADSESERETPLSAAKKRRLDPPLSASERARASLPKKPVQTERSSLPPPRPVEIKKEASPALAFSPPRGSVARSPLPPRADTKPTTSSNGKSTGRSDSRADSVPRRSVSSKPRRNSPIYTSSSADGEGDADADGDDDPSFRPATANSSASSDGAPPRAKPVKSFARFTPRRPFPCNSPDLRKYWRVCHAAYTALCERHQLLRDTAARLLADINAGRSGEETVMDVDPESLMPEVAHAFAEELKTVEDELNKIRDAWRRLGGGLTDGRELC